MFGKQSVLALFAATAALVTSVAADSPNLPKITPCQAGSGPQSGCSKCYNSSTIEPKPLGQVNLTDWNNLNFATSQEATGGGGNTWFSVPTFQDHCKILFFGGTPGLSPPPGVPGLMVAIADQGGCYYVNTGNKLAVSYCCGDDECERIGAGLMMTPASAKETLATAAPPPDMTTAVSKPSSKPHKPKTTEKPNKSGASSGKGASATKGGDDPAATAKSGKGPAATKGGEELSTAAASGKGPAASKTHTGPSSPAKSDPGPAPSKAKPDPEPSASSAGGAPPAATNKPNRRSNSRIYRGVQEDFPGKRDASADDGSVVWFTRPGAQTRRSLDNQSLAPRAANRLLARDDAPPTYFSVPDTYSDATPPPGPTVWCEKATDVPDSTYAKAGTQQLMGNRFKCTGTFCSKGIEASFASGTSIDVSSSNEHSHTEGTNWSFQFGYMGGYTATGTVGGDQSNTDAVTNSTGISNTSTLTTGLSDTLGVQYGTWAQLALVPMLKCYQQTAMCHNGTESGQETFTICSPQTNSTNNGAPSYIAFPVNYGLN